MNKFLCLLLAFSLVLGVMVMPASAAAPFTDIDEDYISVINGLGIMSGYDDGTFLPDQTMKRGEFAQLIANMCDVGSDDAMAWREKYLKNHTEVSDKLVTEFEGDAVPVFSDVEPSHWAYDAVNTAYAFGLMNGVAPGVFEPDSVITVEQAYKVVVAMLGYTPRAEMDGGYPMGYRIWAKRLGLDTGVTSEGNIMRKDVARIVYNALDVEMLQTTGMGKVDSYQPMAGYTFLTEVLGCTYTEGRMTDNGIATFYGRSNLEGKAVVVDGTEILIDTETEYVRDFIGRDVRLYHTNDKSLKKQIAIFAMLTGEDEEVVFQTDSFDNYANNKISYYDARGNRRSIAVDNAKMIYNGTGSSSYSKSDFEANKGTIKVITGKGKRAADLFVVDTYTSFYVDAIDTVARKIYSKVTLFGNSNVVLPSSDLKGVVDLSDETKVSMIYTESDELVDISYITTGMVLSVSDSPGITRIKVSGKKIAGAVISSLHPGTDNVKIKVGEETYILAKDYVDIKGISDISAGGAYDLYIDAFGEVVNVVKSISTDKEIVLLTGVSKTDDAFDPSVIIRYLDLQGELVTGYFAKKVRVLSEEAGVDVERAYSTADALYNAIKDHNKLLDGSNAYTLYGGIVRISKDEAGDVRFIEFPGLNDMSDTRRDRLMRIKFDVTETLDSPATSMTFKSGSGFRPKIPTNSSTKVFQYNPEDLDDAESYRVAGHGVFSDDEGCKVLCYNTDGGSPLAGYILFPEAFTSTMGISTEGFHVVKELSRALNDDGDVVNVVSAYNSSGTLTEFFCTDEVLNAVKDRFGSDVDPYSGQKYALEMGDIFRYATEADGSLKRIEIVFDENATNPASGGQGNLAGTMGKYMASGYDTTMYGENAPRLGKTNPYANHDQGTSTHNPLLNANVIYPNPLTAYSAAQRNMLCYPLKAGSGYMYCTTLDLSVYDYEVESQKDTFASEYILETGGGGTIFMIDGDTIEPIKSSIMTYEIAGKDCDRIFNSSRHNRHRVGIVIRGYTK